MFVPPKKEEANEIPGDAEHFTRTEIDLTNFKKENLASKVRKTKTRKPYVSKEKTQDVPKDSETTETIKTLDDIATLEAGKKCSAICQKNQ